MLRIKASPNRRKNNSQNRRSTQICFSINIKDISNVANRNQKLIKPFYLVPCKLYFSQEKNKIEEHLKSLVII